MKHRVECDSCEAVFEIKSLWEEPIIATPTHCPYCGADVYELNIEEIEDE